MTTQKAFYLLELKGNFAVKERDIQEPAPGEMLIEVHSAGLNPVDWKIQATGAFKVDYPAILGADGAGIVSKLGDGVTNFTVGDKVVFEGKHDNHHATFQQYTIVPAEIVAKVPPNLTLDQAASIPVAIATAAVGLYNPKSAGGLELTAPWDEGGRGKYSGEPIFIIGGSSAVGQQVIQLARLSGFSPIIITASLRNEAYLRSLGATHVIDRAVPLAELPALVSAIAGKPVKVAYDPIGEPETQNAVYDTLADGGKAVIVSSLAIEKGKLVPSKELAFPYGQVHVPANRELGKRLYASLTGLLESGEIKPNNVEVLPGGLAGIPDGLERLRKGVSALKFIARPQENA